MAPETRHLTSAELRAALPDLGSSPRDAGHVEMIVARPAEDQRRVLEEGHFTREDGLSGDGWRDRGSRYTGDGSAHPSQQVALINRRFLDLIAGSRDRWSLAGDQLVVDLDLSVDNLGPGARLQAGDVVFEVTDLPHTGCAKFRDRYGVDAVRFANSPQGKHQRLRGMYVKVVVDGSVRTGDVMRKISGAEAGR